MTMELCECVAELSPAVLLYKYSADTSVNLLCFLVGKQCFPLTGFLCKWMYTLAQCSLQSAGGGVVPCQEQLSQPQALAQETDKIASSKSVR